jgi:sialic acid synthase SpsE/sugar phosphate isomerase/epimerase
MLIERNIAPFVIFDQEPLFAALVKLDQNKSGFVVATTEKGHLLGVLTDGDIRRQLINSKEIDLQTPVAQIANVRSTSMAIDAQPERVATLFSERIRAVPLVDEYNRVVAIAFRDKHGFHIGSRAIDHGQPTYIIAEIGNNHNGDMELGRRLIDAALEAGADCAKFQLRDMRLHYKGGRHAADIGQDLGAEYTLDVLSRFNLRNDDLLKLFDYCHERGIEPLCTPWDVPSVDVLDRYGLAAFKVASADLTNQELLRAIASTRRPLICSTGMASEAEIKECVSFLQGQGASFRLLHCNSTYPTPYKDINLRYMDRLAELSGAPVGYSGHERGWFVAVAAVARGACIVEKHLTLDRSMEGNDHKVSLLPQEFAEMVRAIRTVEESMGNAAPRLVTQGEMLNRVVLAKSVCAERDIFPGELISKETVSVRAPGQGLPTKCIGDLVGRRANRTIKAGSPFFASDLQELANGEHRFAFKRRWGIPVRWHDYRAMMASTKPSLLEYHLSFVDMEADLNRWFSEALDVEFVVHAPELFRGDHILDLASNNQAHRERSTRELQRVIEIARTLKKWHPRTESPLIVTNIGGVTTSGALTRSERLALYKRVEDSLGKLDREGVEIVPQTMPPFPWHFGGQAFHNLFMDPDEIAQFCEANKMRICLDTSHSQLYCNHTRASMRRFCEKVAPYTAHLHLADARGKDGEGLQIGEGMVDFPSMAEILEACCPDASFIPEVWQGHQDGGTGFWSALQKLEQWFGPSDISAADRRCKGDR